MNSDLNHCNASSHPVAVGSSHERSLKERLNNQKYIDFGRSTQ